jgi:serine/threonine protein kinase
VPVLVDFGLAGRKVRPGCGSPYYGAPEVWDMSAFGERVDPRATDVYAFSCLAFELLTGKPLFAGETLPAIFAAHLSHDGNPPGLEWMRKHDRHGPLAELLSAGWRASRASGWASRPCARACSTSRKKACPPLPGRYGLEMADGGLRFGRPIGSIAARPFG